MLNNDLSDEALEDAIRKLREFRDERGETRKVKPTKIYIQPGITTIGEAVKLIEKAT